jgi:signal transduction histidine kinase
VTRIRSLHSRLLLGGLLWLLAVSLATHLVVTAVVLQHAGRQVRLVAHFGALGLLALGFAVVGFSLVRKGLASMAQLRRRLLAVREGQDPRVQGTYPTEVQPLVDDLNALLDEREQRVARALAKAGDLAHGLKTPLAVLSQEAEQAGAAGHHEMAGRMSQQLVRMRRQIDYHLAHARAAASGTAGARCLVVESAEGLSRTLLRLHAGRGLAIRVDVSAGHSVRVQREDLDEMLGNLLDNGCQWAKSRVEVTSSASETGIVITVDDDGPGLAASMREVVLQRGVRADEAAAGSGFGLAIVRELAELYGGSISLGASPLGGLRAKLQLPAG